MIAVDTNVLVYAHRRDSPFHHQAWAVVSELAEGHRRWAIPWPCVHEFYSVVTHPRIYAPPSTIDEATSQLRAWMESASLLFVSETDGHLDRVMGLCERGDVRGPLVHDARVAAICLANGVEALITIDRDFSRFPELQTRSLIG